MPPEAEDADGPGAASDPRPHAAMTSALISMGTSHRIAAITPSCLVEASPTAIAVSTSIATAVHAPSGARQLDSGRRPRRERSWMPPLPWAHGPWLALADEHRGRDVPIETPTHAAALVAAMAAGNSWNPCTCHDVPALGAVVLRVGSWSLGGRCLCLTCGSRSIHADRDHRVSRPPPTRSGTFPGPLSRSSARSPSIRRLSGNPRAQSELGVPRWSLRPCRLGSPARCLTEGSGATAVREPVPIAGNSRVVSAGLGER